MSQTRARHTITSNEAVVHHSKFDRSTSVLGQKQTSDQRPSMSALPPKADIAGRQSDVRFVPKADIMQRSNPLGLLDMYCRIFASRRRGL
jgi:hypothetical protein